VSGRPGTFDIDAVQAALDDIDAVQAAVGLVEEGARLSTNLTSVYEVVDQLLLNTPVKVLRVAARCWLVDQIEEFKAEVQEADRIRPEQGGGGSHD